MKDANFLKAHNARSLWHPMTAPAASKALRRSGIKPAAAM